MVSLWNDHTALCPGKDIKIFKGNRSCYLWLLFYKKLNHKAFTTHYFYPDCSHYFGSNDNRDPDDTCSCSQAKSVETAKRQNCFFCYWKVPSQLELLWQDEDIVGCLLNRVECATDYFKDCTDGKMYAHLRQVYGPNDISLLWNIDGVPVFRFGLFKENAMSSLYLT